MVQKNQQPDYRLVAGLFLCASGNRLATLAWSVNRSNVIRSTLQASVATAIGPISDLLALTYWLTV